MCYSVRNIQLQWTGERAEDSIAKVVTISVVFEENRGERGC